MAPRTVSVVNMKGGVGKSTTVASLAEALAAESGLRGLVVDFDPQSNVSMMLAGLDRWSDLRAGGQTIDELLAAGSGALVLSHVNDAGFWLIKEFFNMTVPQTLRTWTVAETIVGVAGLGFTLLLAQLI